jgi:hypothetical protein
MPATASPTRRCDRCGARLARHNHSVRCAPCSSPRTLIEPPMVPREFWNAPEMRHALATWHMGRVIDAYRHHPWHGQAIPQSVVGNWFGLTQTQLSRIENGRAPEEMSKLVRWVKLLGIPPELLWFKMPGNSTGPAETSFARRQDIGELAPRPALHGGSSIIMDADRALGAGGEITAQYAITRANPAPSRVNRAPTADTKPRPPDPEKATAPTEDPTARAVITAIGATLHATSADHPERDHASLRRDVMRAWELRQSSEYARLGSLLTDLLRDTADTGANATASVHVCNMASSLLKRLGAYEMAAMVADRAFRAASQAGSGLLIGAAKLRVANVYLSASRHPEAVAVAAAAADDLLPRKTSAPEEVATFGALLLTAAVGAAKMGEAARAWEFLGHARAATGVDDREHADLYAVFGPVNLAVHGVQVATELGDGREALRRADKTDPGRMPAVLLERRSTLLIDIARAQQMQRDHAAAAETLIEAEKVAPLEVRYSSAVRSLLPELLSASAHPSGELRELASRLHAAA